MNIEQIDHVQITIPRGAEDRAREFYCTLLGLSELEKPEALKSRGGLWLQVGDKQLQIGTEDKIDRNMTKAHVAYRVADVQVWKEFLQSNGVNSQDGIPIPGFNRFEFRDPFGNRIEFIEQID